MKIVDLKRGMNQVKIIIIIIHLQARWLLKKQITGSFSIEARIDKNLSLECANNQNPYFLAMSSSQEITLSMVLGSVTSPHRLQIIISHLHTKHPIHHRVQEEEVEQHS